MTCHLQLVVPNLKSHRSQTPTGRAKWIPRARTTSKRGWIPISRWQFNPTGIGISSTLFAGDRTRGARCKRKLKTAVNGPWRSYHNRISNTSQVSPAYHPGIWQTLKMPAKHMCIRLLWGLSTCPSGVVVEEEIVQRSSECRARFYLKHLAQGQVKSSFCS